MVPNRQMKRAPNKRPCDNKEECHNWGKLRIFLGGDLQILIKEGIIGTKLWE